MFSTWLRSEQGASSHPAKMAPSQSPSACLGEGNRLCWEWRAQFAGRRAGRSAPGLWKPYGYRRKLQNQKGSWVTLQRTGVEGLGSVLTARSLTDWGCVAAISKKILAVLGRQDFGGWHLEAIRLHTNSSPGRRMIKNNINLQHTYSMTVWTRQLLEEHSWS